MIYLLALYLFFFFNDTATTEIYTLSLHDALPISVAARGQQPEYGQYREQHCCGGGERCSSRSSGLGDAGAAAVLLDRKSTRLNSSHQIISYAVFCLKKKKKNK